VSPSASNRIVPTIVRPALKLNVSRRRKSTDRARPVPVRAHTPLAAIMAARLTEQGFLYDARDDLVLDAEGRRILPRCVHFVLGEAAGVGCVDVSVFSAAVLLLPRPE